MLLPAVLSSMHPRFLSHTARFEKIGKLLAYVAHRSLRTDNSVRSGMKRSLWIIAALERTRPCAAHPRTLRRAKRLTETLVDLIEEGEHTITPAAAMASEATARKEIR